MLNSSKMMGLRLIGRQQRHAQKAVRSWASIDSIGIRGASASQMNDSNTSQAFPRHIGNLMSSSTTTNGVSQRGDHTRGSVFAPLGCFDLTLSEDDDGG